MKDKKPVIPRYRVRDELVPSEDEVPMTKWNIKAIDGEVVMDMLDKDALPLQKPVFPKKKKGK